MLENFLEKDSFYIFCSIDNHHQFINLVNTTTGTKKCKKKWYSHTSLVGQHLLEPSNVNDISQFHVHVEPSLRHDGDPLGPAHVHLLVLPVGVPQFRHQIILRWFYHRTRQRGELLPVPVHQFLDLQFGVVLRGVAQDAHVAVVFGHEHLVGPAEAHFRLEKGKGLVTG